jgi:hypothetical protein
MASPKQIREALLNLMAAKKTNEMTSSAAQRGPDPSRPIGPENTQEFLDFENRMGAGMVHGARQQAREVQGTDQLAERAAGRTLIGGGANTDAPGFDVGEAMTGTQGRLGHSPSRLPDSEAAAIRRQQEEMTGAEYPSSGILSDTSSPGMIAYEAGLLMDQAADGIKNVDPARLARLREVDPGFADSVEKLARGADRPSGVGRATLADDIDDIPF